MSIIIKHLHCTTLLIIFVIYARTYKEFPALYSSCGFDFLFYAVSKYKSITVFHFQRSSRHPSTHHSTAYLELGPLHQESEAVLLDEV